MVFLGIEGSVYDNKWRYLQEKNEQSMNIDYELFPSQNTTLGLENLAEWTSEPTVLDYGIIMICRKGDASLQVNFNHFDLHENAVITLFPNDVVMTTNASPDFVVESLRYDASILREASLQLEYIVYSKLRQNRCRSETEILTRIINAMFSLLKIYFVQHDCTCLNQLVLLQLKAFFLGLYDYTLRFPNEDPEKMGSRRVRELFHIFMNTLENRYRESRDVAFFASLLHITPKYLNIIVQRMTGHNAKTVINHYVVLQLKLRLRHSTLSVKEIAWEYRFSDLSFFCRYFKQHTGLTPQQFRKTIARPELLP